MDKKKIIWTGMALLGLLGGGLGQMYLKNGNPETGTETAAPEVKLATDEFSVRFFQHSLAEKNNGNVLVAPHVVSDALLALQTLSAGATFEELKALKLKEQSVLRGSEQARAALLAMDFNLPRGGNQHAALPLPFSENLPMALSLYNGMLATALGRNDCQLVDSKMVSNRTKLLAGCVTDFRLEWACPFNSANSRTSDFDNASGGMPHFRQMRTKGLFQCAKGDNWKAVALPFKSVEPGAPPLVYIGILPDGSAREFASALTPVQLTGIRKALAEAEAQEMLVEQPRMELQVLPYDMRDSLRRLGLKALFDSEKADFSPISPEKIHLGAFIHACRLSLIESGEAPKADDSLDYAPEYISFSRPYIWLIADLATDTPIEFIGLVEEM